MRIALEKRTNCNWADFKKVIFVNFLITLFLIISVNNICAEDMKWSRQYWSVDNGSAAASILSPYKIKDLPELGIIFGIDENEGWVNFDFNADGIIHKSKRHYDSIDRFPSLKIIIDRGYELITDQEKLSSELFKEIGDKHRILDMGEGSYIPQAIVEETKNRFKEKPFSFMTIYSYSLGNGLDSLVVSLEIQYRDDTDKSRYPQEYTKKLAYFFMMEGAEQKYFEELKYDDYFLFKNKRGQNFLVIKSGFYEGYGIDSYLIEEFDLTHVAELGVGV